jgi:hypothetical protein
MDHLEVVKLLQPAGGKVFEDGKVRTQGQEDGRARLIACIQ